MDNQFKKKNIVNYIIIIISILFGLLTVVFKFISYDSGYSDVFDILSSVSLTISFSLTITFSITATININKTVKQIFAETINVNIGTDNQVKIKLIDIYSKCSRINSLIDLLCKANADSKTTSFETLINKLTEILSIRSDASNLLSPFVKSNTLSNIETCSIRFMSEYLTNVKVLEHYTSLNKNGMRINEEKNTLYKTLIEIYNYYEREKISPIA